MDRTKWTVEEKSGNRIGKNHGNFQSRQHLFFAYSRIYNNYHK